jgi:hypothetical protein
MNFPFVSIRVFVGESCFCSDVTKKSSRRPAIGLGYVSFIPVLILSLVAVTHSRARTVHHFEEVDP